MALLKPCERSEEEMNNLMHLYYALLILVLSCVANRGEDRKMRGGNFGSAVEQTEQNGN